MHFEIQWNQENHLHSCPREGEDPLSDRVNVRSERRREMSKKKEVEEGTGRNRRKESIEKCGISRIGSEESVVFFIRNSSNGMKFMMKKWWENFSYRKREKNSVWKENAYFDGEKEKSNEINEEAVLQRKKYILVQWMKERMNEENEGKRGEKNEGGKRGERNEGGKRERIMEINGRKKEKRKFFRLWYKSIELNGKDNSLYRGTDRNFSVKRKIESSEGEKEKTDFVNPRFLPKFIDIDWTVCIFIQIREQRRNVVPCERNKEGIGVREKEEDISVREGEG